MDRRRRRGLVADAERYLRRQIIRGEIAAGTRLQQEHIAEMLDMSITPVREAIVGLASDGWVVLEPNRGAFVLPITLESVEEWAQLTQLLMEFIMKRAIEHGTTADIARLVTVANRLGQVSRPDELWAELREFNVCLCEMGETTRARTLLRWLGSFILDDIFELVPQTVATTQKSIRELAEAVRDRDVARANAVSLMYLNAHVEALLAWLVEHGVITESYQAGAARVF
jgi:DNA-binding GntR family transcriptional regulator